MKPEHGRQIKSGRGQVIEFKAHANNARFLKQTQESIFHRWMHLNQDEIYLAGQYDVRRREIEEAIRAETRARLEGNAPPPLRRAA